MNEGLPVVYLGLGSNLGNRRRNLAVALSRLEPLVRVEAVSSLYETDPVGPQDQPSFLNAACRAITGLGARGLLRHIQEVEREIGRRAGEPWGPRPIDIDLLLYGNEVIDEPGLQAPHAELAKRAFVLAPLAELAPDISHSALGRTIGALLSEVSQEGVRKVEGPGWENK
ncbi:MAG: 2-amino-4-hydroxy-6-hydroxymethyldihydropteridine diphosphokinase [Dehalococcoidia bacterium]